MLLLFFSKCLILETLGDTPTSSLGMLLKLIEVKIFVSTMRHVGPQLKTFMAAFPLILLHKLRFLPLVTLLYFLSPV
jgi:hypothetical protein